MKAAWLACIVAMLALPAGAADPRKVIRTSFTSAERGFDCVRESDEFTGTLCDNIFDALLQYDHLARPIKLQPRAAAALPGITDGGRTFTFRIKPGIFFTPDAAFKGERRELVAADYVYSLKRFFDPKVRAQWKFLLEGKVVGADALAEEAKRTGKFDYDKPIEGLQAPSRYEFRLKLVEPDYNMLYILTMPATAAMAREVVEHYGEAITDHPVGTGPYKLATWRRSAYIVLEANPEFRETYFETVGGEDERDRTIAKHLEGKRLPIVGRIEMFVIEEAQPRWLAFLNAEHDLIERVPGEFVNIAAPEARVAPNLARRKIQMTRANEHALTFIYFGMENPVVGGYTADKVALRRAISLGVDTEEWIRAVYYGQAIVAQSTVPPGAFGADPDLAGPLAEFNPAKAKALLDTYGYVDRDGDGYRELPDGSKLVLEIASVPDSQGKRIDELWRKQMDRIGLRTEFRKNQWPQHLKDSRAGKLMIWNLGWIAGDPDADTFYQILYGISKGQANHSRFDLPAWNALYKQARTLPDSPERDRLYREMDRLFFVYAPLRPIAHRILTGLAHPWVIGYRRNDLSRELWTYLDIDESALPSPQSRAGAAAAAPAR
jgi:ABC-type transport system substrate-binding protein